MMIAASTIAPIAIAIPPRLMMFAPSPRACIAVNDSRIESGRVRIATNALRRCHKNTTQTSETMMSSSISLPFNVSMDRSIKSERS